MNEVINTGPGDKNSQPDRGAAKWHEGGTRGQAFVLIRLAYSPFHSRTHTDKQKRKHTSFSIDKPESGI